MHVKVRICFEFPVSPQFDNLNYMFGVHFSGLCFYVLKTAGVSLHGTKVWLTKTELKRRYNGSSKESLTRGESSMKVCIC